MHRLDGTFKVDNLGTIDWTQEANHEVSGKGFQSVEHKEEARRGGSRP